MLVCFVVRRVHVCLCVCLCRASPRRGTSPTSTQRVYVPCTVYDTVYAVLFIDDPRHTRLLPVAKSRSLSRSSFHEDNTAHKRAASRVSLGAEQQVQHTASSVKTYIQHTAVTRSASLDTNCRQASKGGGVPVRRGTGRPSLVWLRPRVDRGSATLAPLAAVAAVAAADFGLRGCRVKRV